MLMLNWKRRLTAFYTGLAIMVAFFTPIVHAGGNPSIYDAIVEAGLTTNLKLVLDAGDSQSYDGTSQKWLDRSGGYDFFLGTNGTVQSADPTFNGTAGRLTASEFFSVDGGDYFSYDTTIESWMQAIGKSGGVFTILALIYIPSDTDSSLIASRGASATDYGWDVFYSAALDKMFFRYYDSGGTARSLGNSAATIVPGLHFWAFSGTLTSGQTYDVMIDGTNSSGAIAVTGTTNNPVNNLKMGARGDASGFAVNGTRYHGVAMWQGTRLTQANFTTLWNRLRSRFGL